VTSELISAQWRDVPDSATVVSGGPYEEYSNPWRLSSTIEDVFQPQFQSNLDARTPITEVKTYTGSAHVTENPYALHGEFIYG
jgi:hypothetical protein